MKTTKETRNLFVALSLGDGCINQQGSIKIKHCSKQLEYLQWKADLIKPYLTKGGIKTTLNNNGFPAHYFLTKSFRFIKLLRRILYKPKKQISRSILNRIDNLGWAIIYMDDGSLIKRRNKQGKIHSYELYINTGVSFEENQVYQTYFKEVHNINFSINKNKNVYRLRCGTKEARRFIQLVKPYVDQVLCMQYKIDIDL